MRRPSAAINVKCYIHAVCVLNSRINFVPQPLLRNFLIYDPHVPGKPRSEISSATAESKSALGRAIVEHRVGAADWPTFAEGNHVVRLLHRLRRRLALRC